MIATYKLYETDVLNEFFFRRGGKSKELGKSSGAKTFTREQQQKNKSDDIWAARKAERKRAGGSGVGLAVRPGPDSRAYAQRGLN